MQKRTIVLLVLMLGFVSSCANLAYYHQAVKGQISLLAARSSVDALLANENTQLPLRTQLKKVEAILAFAEKSSLPVGNSYSSYVDLKRPFVVWNVFAASPNSVNLISHCFPIAGCVGYKGFFSQDKAEDFADHLNDSGFDVYVGGVAAYSTLGWFDDPLLNTFLFRDDARLAGILFHELAHKVLYVEGDTVFNESFATAVERHLLKRWLEVNHQESAYAAYLASQARRADVIELILMTRKKLESLYAGDSSSKEMLQQKAELIGQLKQDYRLLQETWSAGNEFSQWIEQDINNAHIGAIGAYQALVPGFSALLQQSGNLPTFFDQVKTLARLPKEERERALINQDFLAEPLLAKHGHANQCNHSGAD